MDCQVSICGTWIPMERSWKRRLGVTTSANTSRILDVLLAKGPGYTAVTGDVTCAFFHADEEEEVYVDPPTEWKDIHGHEWTWKLAKQLYVWKATCAKEVQWQGSISDVPRTPNVEVQGSAHLYFHPVKKVAIEVHLDDFYAVGPGNAPWEVMSELKKFLTLSLEGPFTVGDSFVHLKRKRVITEDGVWITPSDSHLKKLLELTGLNWKSTGRETPQTKDLTASEATGLSPEDSTLCRSIIGILMYLASDRPDIQFTVNELAGMMSKPTKETLEVAKHLTRYLLKTREYGLFFTRSWNDSDDLVVWSDSDWAGDKKTRKSRTAAHLMWGGCLLYSYTRRQTVVAQSSAEAELYATASGVSEGILLRKVLEFVGHTAGPRAITDSSANNAVSHRLGVGKIRHLETKVLWLQDLVYDGRLAMSWIKGQQNRADLGTKVLQKRRIEELRGMIGLGPINTEKIRSITFDRTSWSDMPVGKIIALATVLSKVPLGQGAKTGELVATSNLPSSLKVGFENFQGWDTNYFLILFVLAWILSVLICGWIMSCFFKREVLVAHGSSTSWRGLLQSTNFQSCPPEENMPKPEAQQERWRIEDVRPLSSSLATLKERLARACTIVRAWVNRPNPSASSETASWGGVLGFDVTHASCHNLYPCSPFTFWYSRRPTRSNTFSSNKEGHCEHCATRENKSPIRLLLLHPDSHKTFHIHRHRGALLFASCSSEEWTGGGLRRKNVSGFAALKIEIIVDGFRRGWRLKAFESLGGACT